MCGIAGIFAYRESAPPVDREELLRIREAMIWRGPDGAGLWISDDGRIGLAHRRLSIIDLSEAGAQPMWNADRTLCISFNGEIYNYREIRRELEGRGCRFQSNSDTEVLLHLYAERGRDMVLALRGMFAFAIWDERRKGMFLARDPFGIKPLYYADDGGTIRLASQVKALLAGGNIFPRQAPAGVVGFFLWGWVPEPFTTCRDILALPAGATKWISASRNEEPRQYFSVRDELECAGEMIASRGKMEHEALREIVSDSVKNHLVSDVPVGIFLSAGLDSTTIAAHAAELHAPDLRAITLGFREYQHTPDDEVPLAQAVARLYAIEHRIIRMTKAEFDRDIETMMARMDQPTTDGVNTYFVSKAAAESGIKVALSGLGGDELFGGYASFRHVPLMARLAKPAMKLPWIGTMIRNATAPVLNRLTSPKFSSVFEYGGSYGGAYLLRRGLYMPWELGEFLDPDVVEEGMQALQVIPALDASIRGIEDEHARVSALELQWYMRNQLLRDADWAGMAHSVEIRVPLVDVVLFRALAPFLKHGAVRSKSDFARTPKRPLPQEVIRRAKTGFVLPVREWVAARSGRKKGERGLRSWAKQVFAPRKRFRVLTLLTDGFGGRGGIAKFNRDLLGAVCSMPYCDAVVALPRLIVDPLASLPPKLTYVQAASGGKVRYVAAVIQTVFRYRFRFDLIICAHINLVPLAYPLSRLLNAPVLMFIHGIEAWAPTHSVFGNLCTRRVDAVTAVSQVTLDRFRSWAHSNSNRCYVLPNCVDLSLYAMGPKPSDLEERYGLKNRTVLLTVGRMSELERYKGFDEVMESLAELAKEGHELVYLIGGEGPDRSRLERKAKSLGVADRVIFAGFVEEKEKASFYRLADAYVMPSRGEGFGIVFLEAMACGIPVLGSSVDGGREALMGGELGALVDPADPDQVKKGILKVLGRGKHIPERLGYFSFEAFEKRTDKIVSNVVFGGVNPTSGGSPDGRAVEV